MIKFEMWNKKKKLKLETKNRDFLPLRSKLNPKTTVLCGEHEAGRWKGETWSEIGENWGFWVRKGERVEKP